MLKTLGIIQTCLGSGGSTGVCSRRLGSKTVLEWVCRRVTDCQRLDGVVVLSDGAATSRFLSTLVPADVPIVTVEADDPLHQFAAATEQYRCEAVVRVRSDRPFVDPTLIDHLVTTAEAHESCDYVSYCSRDGRPAILSPVGVYAEWIRTEALRRADRKARTAADRKEVTRYVYGHPEQFNLRLIRAPQRVDRDDLRLTVDIEEDWEHLLTIVDALGADEIDWRRIANLLDHQPALRDRMAALNRQLAKS
ncbi:MAG TPA: NTP transferase domain-containing protein [Thermoguttaceae bacterium]|nr:NTP transferase domain-containing protein [Thermoguttaceae bacterium]